MKPVIDLSMASALIQSKKRSIIYTILESIDPNQLAVCCGSDNINQCQYNLYGCNGLLQVQLGEGMKQNVFALLWGVLLWKQVAMNSTTDIS